MNRAEFNDWASSFCTDREHWWGQYMKGAGRKRMCVDCIWELVQAQQESDAKRCDEYAEELWENFEKAKQANDHDDQYRYGDAFDAADECARRIREWQGYHKK